MEWTDDALILGAQKHGESSVILDLLSHHHGRHKGLVRGGTSRRMRGVLEPGNRVDAAWKARLSEHLGNFTIELTHAYSAALLHQPDRLLALMSLCAVAELVLPEREPHPEVFEATLPVMDLLAEDEMPVEGVGAAIVRWELGVLGALGYRLELEVCAVTGQVENLAFVSPKSGRAVSREAAGDYADRLLPLPAFLAASGPRKNTITPEDVVNGLDITGYFIDRRLLVPHRLRLPPARDRFLAHLKRLSAGESRAGTTTSGRE